MVYLVYGSDPFIVRWNTKNLLKIVENKDFDLRVSENMDADVYTYLCQYPMFGEHRGVLLRISKLSDLDKNTYFEKYLKKGEKTPSILVINADSVDTRISLYKRVCKEPGCKVIKCDKLDEKRLTASILKHLNECGARITKDALKLFISRVNYLEIEEVNMYELINTLDKLVQYCKDITVDSVRAVVKENVKDNIFSLTSMLLSGDMASCYKQLDVLLNKRQSPINIFSLLLREFRLAYKADALGVDKTALGVYFAPRKLPRAVCVRCMEILNDAVNSCKASIFQDKELVKIVFEQLYYEIHCSEKLN